MDAFSEKLNAVLSAAFQSVLKLEEQMLHSMGAMRLSISEVHMLEAVGKSASEGRSIGDLARELSVAMPTVTIAVRKLEGKGLVQRARGAHDARTVWITLTEAGRKINRVHARFHENMARNIAADLGDEERAVLLRSMEKLNDHFERRLIRNK